MGFGEDIKNISEMVETEIFDKIYEDKDPFKGVSKKDLEKRGYTGLKYGLWVGSYFDGYVTSKEYALNWAKEMVAKYGQEEIRVYEIPAERHLMSRGGNQIFPKIQEDIFKGPSEEDLKDRGVLTQKERIEQDFIRFRVMVLRNNPIYTDPNGKTYTNGDIRRILFMTNPEKYRALNGLYAVSKDSYQDKFRVSGIHGTIIDTMTAKDLLAKYEKSLPSRGAPSNPYDRFGYDCAREELEEADDPFKGPSQADLDARPDYQQNKIKRAGLEMLWAQQAERRRQRMITHPDQPNLAKQWVEGGRDRGRASNLRVVGDIMISYGTPIAIRQNTFIYMVNQKFSQSTSRQQGYIRRAAAGAGADAIELSVSDFKDKLDEIGSNFSYGWLREAQDPFKGPSQEDLQKRGALKYLPRTGNFPYKFMKYIADPDPSASNWDIVGIGHYVNYDDSDVYFGADEDPQFIIMFDTEAVLEDNLDTSPELTKELEDFDGPIEEWLRFKGWGIEFTGHTANEDSAYYWGDEVYAYTSFNAEKDGKILGGVVIEFKTKDMVYLGLYWDAEAALTIQDPEQEIADAFGYSHYKNLVYDMKTFRGTLTPEEEEGPRDREPTPGQKNWDFNRGDGEGNYATYTESRLAEDVFQSANPQEVHFRKTRAKEIEDRAKEEAKRLRREQYNFPYTYEDIIQLPIYKKIIELSHIVDLPTKIRKRNRSLHLQYNDGNIIKDWVVAATGRIGSNSGENFRGGSDYRIKQFPRAATLEEFIPTLEWAYNVIHRFVNKMEKRKVREDVFKGVDPEELKKRQAELSRIRWNIEAEIRKDIIEIENSVDRTGTGYWEVIDLQKVGTLQGEIFNSLEDVRINLAGYHSIDWNEGEDEARDVYDEKLSTLLEVGNWDIHELTRTEIATAREEGDLDEMIDLKIKEDIFKGVSPEDLAKRREHVITEDDIMSLEQDIIDVARTEANYIYQKLEESYDYLNSDEAVKEDILANEREFSVDPETGKLDEAKDPFSGASKKDVDKRTIAAKAERIANGSVFFEDLDEEDQQTAIDNIRENPYYLDYEWWDGLIGQRWKDKDGKWHEAKGFYDEELEKKGFEDTEIGFSGFYSQGDGASFSCNVNVPKVVEYYSIKVKPTVQKALDEGLFYGAITKNDNHYSHANTMNLDLQYEGDEY